MHTSRLLLIGILLLPLSLAGCDGADDGGLNDDGSTGETGDSADTGETGEAAPLDTDADGLTDDEEAELGTDPAKKDTDGDNYWDLWEINEGTDPLDYDSRIYTGFWPYNPDKNELEQGSWETTNTQVGTAFPRDSFLDHHGDMVDLYDFTNFTINETNQAAYFIFDLSAQWCGPCHNVANWISGVDSPDTEWIQELYPSVRGKVHGLQIWWMTFLVEANDGSPPTIADVTTWYEIHQDAYIPLLVDADLELRNRFMGPAFPHFFLLDPTMHIEFFPGPADSTDANPYPAVGLVEKYL
ncbi:hypothetical protein ENSA5_62400 [Enhygromyxa salina]|uniref:Thioredoxin domain-containing protein n=1 Tax=Enhygromyxa salina TaxID=215803 RepID=A0A2S9XCV7_9BACT|nr:thrombospondin type 3 repeat-containing protein [Enhygromyxa salina]PRP90694.1 hypothetical protein ENSA5_62400 [Enhygromyxa salina]